MSAPDWYETYLLGKAVEACPHLRFDPDPHGEWVLAKHEVLPDGQKWFSADTLEAALTALLDDLDVAYEPRPSAEEVREADVEWQVRSRNQAQYLRALYASGDRGRLLASAVIAGAPDA